MKHLVLLLLIGISTSHVKADGIWPNCAGNIQPNVAKAINTLSNTGEITIIYPSCSEVLALNNLKSDDIFITTGRINESETVCLSDDRSNPCKFIIGTITSNQYANEILSQAFGIQREIDLTKPIEESIERLFIKPSGEILPRQSEEK